MKKFSSVFSYFHTDIMNKYIFPVQIFRNIFFRKSYITTNDTLLCYIQIYAAST